MDGYRDAITRKDRPLWLVEMQMEMDQHVEIRTWDLVEIPEGRKEIGCQWVYAMKTMPEGEFEKYKAHIIMQGFTQHPGHFEVGHDVFVFVCLEARSFSSSFIKLQCLASCVSSLSFLLIFSGVSLNEDYVVLHIMSLCNQSNSPSAIA